MEPELGSQIVRNSGVNVASKALSLRANAASISSTIPGNRSHNAADKIVADRSTVESKAALRSRLMCHKSSMMPPRALTATEISSRNADLRPGLTLMAKSSMAARLIALR